MHDKDGAPDRRRNPEPLADSQQQRMRGTTMLVFALCTYADGDRWTSAIEPLLYPTGVTFYRPFSYRTAYFEPTLTADQLRDPAQRSTLLKQPTWNTGFFGVRFRRESGQEFMSRFVPLRRVTIVDASVSDVLNLRFKLGSYIVPQHLPGESPALPRIDLSPLIGDLAETKLFIYLPDTQSQVAAQWGQSDDFPRDFWTAFERELSTSAWDRIRNAVMLRLAAVRRRGETAKLQATEIDKKTHIWGYELQQNKTYDLELSHNRLIQQGQDIPAVQQQYRLSNPVEEIAASKRSIQIIGNYRADDTWVSPLIFTQGPIEIAFEPARLDQPQAVVDELAARTIGIKLPVIVRKKRWPAIRWINLFLFVALSVISALILCKYKQVSDATQKVLLVVVAALLSVAVNALKDFVTGKE